jgi:hypothetical protein
MDLMGEEQKSHLINAHQILVGNPIRNDRLEDLGVNNGRVIPKQDLHEPRR